MTCAFLYALKDTVCVPDLMAAGCRESNLNNAVDPVINSWGNLSRVVFKLRQYGLYSLTGAVNTPAVAVLEIDADPPGTMNAYSTVNDFPAELTFTFTGLDPKEFHSQKKFFL